MIEENEEEKESKIKEIVEFKNGNIFSCNYLGLKIYYKNKEKYDLNKKINLLDVIGAIEIKPNLMLIFEKHSDNYGSGVERNIYHSFSLSVWDIQKKKILI